MKLSRRELLSTGAVSVVSGVTVRGRSRPAVSWPQTTPARTANHPPNLPIRDYLAREASRITDASLADLQTPAAFAARIPHQRRARSTRCVPARGVGEGQAAKATGERRKVVR